MREIKFREIFFKDYGETSIEVLPNCLEYVGDQCHNGEPQRGRFLIDQYTGLNDKNGVEIYEGDVVNFFFVDRFLDVMKYTKQVVVFENQMFSARFPLHKVKDIEVIGNIHSNPELLK